MNYNYQNLSPDEFEKVTHSLLNLEFDIRFEEFASGKDSGIDLRHSKARNDNSIIVQCKRYQAYTDLKSKIKNKELVKIKKLNPERYILFTSVDLSVNQKDELLILLEPYVKSTGDIYGKKDIDSLLGKYPEVEKKHYKLFLTSSTALELLLKSKIINQTELELLQINEEMKKYVQNNSFPTALKILNEVNYCIISGEPGIGKTTLAHALIHHYLRYDFNVYVVRSIGEAVEVYQPTELQFIYFDDFLGDTTVDMDIQDQDFIRFLKGVKNTNKTKFVVSTRNYLLTKAIQKSEVFERERVLLSEQCIINLSDYTKFHRAKILANHLDFAGLNWLIVESLFKDKFYNKIIEHPNYSPRLIRLIVEDYSAQERLYGTRDDFSVFFLKMLSNPSRLWAQAFEKNGDAAQTMLLCLSTLDIFIDVKDLRDVFSIYYKKRMHELNKAIMPDVFEKTLKQLEGTFLEITHLKNKKTYVRFKNPAVRDFLHDYLNRNREEIELLLTINLSFDHLFYILANFDIARTLELNVMIQEKYDQTLEKQFKEDIFSKTFMVLEYFLRNFDYDNSDLILSKFLKFITDREIEEYSSYAFSNIILIIAKFDITNSKFREILNVFFSMISLVEFYELQHFENVLIELKKIDYPGVLLLEKEIKNKITSEANWIEEVDSQEISEMSYSADDLEVCKNLAIKYDIDIYDAIEHHKEFIEDINDYEFDEDLEAYREQKFAETQEKAEIDSIFDALRSSY